jgi:hypothetical protein
MPTKGSKRYVSYIGLPLLMAAGAVTAGSSAELQWTQLAPATGATSTIQFTDVIYAGGRYVAVGTDPANGLEPTGTIMESSDGVTWNTVFQQDNTAIQSVAYGNGVYVAVGEGQLEFQDGIPPVELTGSWLSSPDGVHWTVDNNVGPAPVTDVVFGNGIFAVYADNCDPLAGDCGASHLYTSADGKNWTPQTPMSGQTELALPNLGFADGEFITLAASDRFHTTAYTSSDGVGWTATSTLGTHVNITRIRVTGDTVSAVGYTSSPVVAISQDGRNWTVNVSGSYGDNIRYGGSFTDIARYGDGYLVTFTDGDNFSGQLAWPEPGKHYPLAMSVDGTHWCNLRGYPTTDQGLSLVVVGGQVITVGDGGTMFSTGAAASPDASLKCDAISFQSTVTVGTPVTSSGGGGGGDMSLLELGLLLGFAMRLKGGARRPA